MPGPRIATLAAALALDFARGPVLAQDAGTQGQQSDSQTPSTSQATPGRGMAGQGRGMMGQGQGRMAPGQGQGRTGPGPGMMSGQGMMPGQGMVPGQRMPGDRMPSGRMGTGAGPAGPTLQVQTPAGLSFTCTADIQACMQALKQLNAGASAGDRNN